MHADRIRQPDAIGQCPTAGREVAPAPWVIIGGTFDPIHVGHLHLASAAVERLGAVVGVLAVGEAHRHRPPTVLPWNERVRLVRAAVANTPHLVEASEIEGTWADDRGIVEIGRSLSSSERALHFVFGSDSAARLGRWSGSAELLQLGTVWSVERTSASTVLMAGIRRLDLDTLNISATEVRARCATGAAIDGLVAPSIQSRVSQAYGNAASFTSSQPLALPA